MAGVFQPSNSGFDRASSDPNEFVGDRNGIETPSLPERPNIAEFVDTLTHLKSELAKTGQLDKGKVPEYLLQLQKFSLLVEKYSLNVQQTLGARINTPTEAQLRQLRQVWGEMTAQLQGADTLSDLLELGTIHVQRYLNADRVLIYRFDADSTPALRRDPQGMVVAEALQRGWTPTLGETLPPMCFGRDRPQDYERSPMVSLPDIRTLNLTPYQRQLLERFQVQASLTIPILLGNSIWGLLVAHQCASARQWTEVEMTLLNQLSIYLTARLQEYDFSDRLRQQTEADRTISQIIERIRQSSDLDTIFKTTVREVRRLMSADRVGVFQFYPDAGYDDGEFVAEDVQSGYPSAVAAKIHDHCFGSQYAAQYASGRIQAVADIYNANFSDCHISVLSQFEVRANLIVPLLQNNQLWGLLCVHQCSAPREWQDEDLELAKRIATQFTIALQQAQTVAQLRQQSEKAVEAQSRDRAVLQIIERIRQSLDLDNIFKTTVREIRRLLEADRVGVFQFYPDAGYDDGEFVAEDVQSGYPSAVAAKIHDHCFGSQYADKYADGRIQAVADIHNAGLSDCHISVLSQFGVRANLIVPLLQGNQLWGLLCVQQCSAPREWQAEEIDFVKHIAAQFTLALQQAEYVGQLQAKNEEVARSQSRDRAVSQIIERIRQSLDLDNIFKTTVREIRRLLEADRVGVFQFYPDAGYDDGEFVAEDVQSGYPSAVAAKIHDHCFGNQYADKYADGRIQSVADIHNAGLSDCHINVLSQFGVRANLIVPLLKGNQLWGLLCVHQCSAPREWQAEEIDFVKRIAAQFTLALQQAEYVDRLQQQTEQIARSQSRDRAVSQIIERIRQSLDLDNIFKTTVREIRRLLEADRVGVFQFYPDAGYDDGEFVAEDVQSGYPSAIAAKIHDHCFGNQFADKYIEGRIQSVADIHNAGLSDCHIEVLSQFSVRANLIVPLLKGKELWGLLCVHQCSAPREWQEEEIDFVKRIAAQFTIALQQVEYLKQLEVQSQQLTEAAEQAKAARTQIQQRAIALLMAVRPALDGDLTVRAPITEDEIGTLADMYNNTIQSLRKIVLQVQGAAEQVVQTSLSSGASLMQLSGEAQKQFQEISRALDQIQEMVNFTQETAANAQQVEQALEQASITLETGDKAMNRTVEGIMEIRKTVGEAVKRIKRLDKSSESIAKVVNLINNFATQTRLLAMNAAIEATRAGEYGRGFAVVADEVRSLAQQSSDATTEIEKLVQEIQMETKAVRGVMDIANQRVVAGTNLVGETWKSLNEVVEAAGQIGALVQGITHATQVQTEQAQSVTQRMQEIAAIADQTSKDSIQISASFKDALTTAQDLQSSAGRFKVS
jgi:methyl-accepting chemotaxis protein PixJ